MGHANAAIRHLRGPGDAEIALLATRQHGVVGYAQLLALGFTPRAIRYRVEVGRLHPLYRGVYAVGHAVLSREGRWMAAVLACGNGAVLSHRDAAALLELRRSARRAIDVTTIRGRARAGRDRITLHRVRRIHPDDRTVRDGIPVTGVARTLLDLAEVVDRRQLERAVEQAERLHLFDLRAVDALLARSRGRRGIRPLRAVLAAYRPTGAFTRSDLERLLIDLCREADLPDPAMNMWVEGHEVDALYAERRVAIEIDGGDYHDTTAARRRDPRRDAELQAAGYSVLRVSGDWLTADAAGVQAAILKLYFRKPS